MTDEHISHQSKYGPASLFARCHLLTSCAQIEPRAVMCVILGKAGKIGIGSDNSFHSHVWGAFVFPCETFTLAVYYVAAM